jgi:Streptomycin adenylyltransferase
LSEDGHEARLVTFRVPYPAAVLVLPDESAVVNALVAWGDSRSDVRAMILTSSRARQDATADVLADYGVIVAASDPEQLAGWGWVTMYGEPMTR